MSPLFQIQPEGLDARETNFFAEVNNAGLSFFFQRDEDKMVTGLSVFHFDREDEGESIADKLKAIFSTENLPGGSFNRVFISYAYSESILTPAAYQQDKNEEDLIMVYGDLKKGVVFTDYVKERNIYNNYRIPGVVHQVVTNRFEKATYIHQYSALLRQLPAGGDVFRVIFYPGKMVITLQKQDKLQLMHTFKYVTPNDVVYHLLNLCEQLNARDLQLQLCGMLEKDSALFKTIRHHFSNPLFCGLPAAFSYADKIKELPAHYFSHLFELAACV